jgi:hypothetical protein
MQVDLYEHKEFDDILLIVPCGSQLKTINVENYYDTKRPTNTLSLKPESAIHNQLRKDGYAVGHKKKLQNNDIFIGV